MKMGSFDFAGMKELQKNLQKLQNPDAFVEACAKELAQRLFRELIHNTPYITHTLERGWTIGNVQQCDGGYMVEIVNPVEYASYVNYGHRTIKKDGYGWAPALLFVEKALGNVKKMSKLLLEKRMNDYLKDIIKSLS